MTGGTPDPAPDPPDEDCVLSWGQFHHRVRPPYEPWGTGYACTPCIDEETQP